MKKLLVFFFVMYGCRQEAIDPSLGVAKGSINGKAWNGKSQIRAYLSTVPCGEKKISLDLRIPIGSGLDMAHIGVSGLTPRIGSSQIIRRFPNQSDCATVKAGLSLLNYDVFLDQVFVLEKASFNQQITINRIDTVANRMEGNFQILFGDSENRNRVLPDTVLVQAEFSVPITRQDL
jgi:hypothetical protein